MKKLNADVLVIGGGAAGVTAARTLLMRGSISS
jgi:glycerol-3-phosphate dehydrogenase